MTAVLLALGASLAWGVADFVGPWQARTLGTLRVLLWAQIGGLARSRSRPPCARTRRTTAAVLLAVPAALSGTLGLYAYYRGMQTGMMSVVAPIAGASAIVPVVFGIATGDRPSAFQLAGIACALVGVALAAQEHQAGRAARRRRRLARGAGGDRLRLLLPADARRGRGRSVVGVADLPRDRPRSWSPPSWRAAPAVRLRGWPLWIVLAVGIGDTLGNLLFAASACHGLVSVTSVLASLYPVVTVGLAAIVLKEHVAGGQRARRRPDADRRRTDRRLTCCGRSSQS